MPKPEIEEIVFTKKEQQQISDILAGKATQAQLKKWEQSSSHFRPEHHKSEYRRLAIIKEKYYHNSVCTICHSLPQWRYKYNYNGAILVQAYCDKCKPS
jgi:Cdc6-like AAA superfamily ATPase